MNEPPPTKLLDASVPLWRIDVPEHRDSHAPPFDWIQMLLGIDPELIRCAFRAVSYHRLDHILQAGIDVDPPDSVIYVDDMSKAWEYGGWPKVILALDWNMLSPTYTEVPATTASAELARLRSIYPTELHSKNGEKIWFTRLEKDDPRVTSEYEVAYARWIPCNQQEALRSVLLFARPSDKLEPRHAA